MWKSLAFSSFCCKRHKANSFLIHTDIVYILVTFQTIIAIILNFNRRIAEQTTFVLKNIYVCVFLYERNQFVSNPCTNEMCLHNVQRRINVCAVTSHMVTHTIRVFTLNIALYIITVSYLFSIRLTGILIHLLSVKRSSFNSIAMTTHS